MAIGDREITLGQFVKQLAAVLQQGGVALPFKNQQPWHLLFYELTKRPAAGRPRFFDELVFDWDAPYPKCQELSEFLHALHFTASVSARNPHYDVINVDPVVAERWSQNLDQDDPELRTFVGAAVELAREEFAAAVN